MEQIARFQDLTTGRSFWWEGKRYTKVPAICGIVAFSDDGYLTCDALDCDTAVLLHRKRQYLTPHDMFLRSIAESLDVLAMRNATDTFVAELITRWYDVKTHSEKTGEGMHGCMLARGLVAWIDDQMHRMSSRVDPDHLSGGMPWCEICESYHNAVVVCLDGTWRAAGIKVSPEQRKEYLQDPEKFIRENLHQ